MRGEAWGRERVELLKRLWASGESAGAIGARLGGISRSAVLGKIFRLRLGNVEPQSPLRPLIDEGAQRARVNGKAPTRESGATTASHPPALIEKDSPVWRRRGSRREKIRQQRAAANRRGKSLLELTNDCCRWPHGRPGTEKFFFCGAPGADLERGIPYCPRHFRRAYLAEPPAAAEPKPNIWRAA